MVAAVLRGTVAGHGHTAYSHTANHSSYTVEREFTMRKSTRKPTTAQRNRRNTAWLVWGTFALCTVLSVAFNIKFTAQATRDPLMLFAAVIWPLAAVLGTELLTRVPWSNGRLWAFARFGGVGAATVAAMYNSAWHTGAVILASGQGWVAAITGPIVIDGLMMVTGAALLAMHTPKPARRRARKPVKRRAPAPVPVLISAPVAA